jgi:branched-chain amino acid transport system substrate-binding protein
MRTPLQRSSRHARLRRQGLPLTAVAVALLLAVAGCAPPGADPDVEEPVVAPDPLEPEEETPEPVADADDDVIRIGFLADTSGTAAASGRDMVRGWDLFWELHGTQVAGREIQTIHLDTTGQPDVGLSQAERLVERDDVHLIVGPLFAHVGLAVADYASRMGVPNFHPVVSADDLTQRQRLPGILRVGGWTSSQTTHPLGEWAHDQGYQTAVTLCSDYAFGHENCGGFANVFTDSGGEIIEQLWNPLNTADFSPYISQIQEADPDVVFVLQVGGDSIRFVESWADFGMKDQIPLLGGETLLDQSLLRGMAPAAATGLVSTGKYAEGRDDPLMEEFVEAFNEAYGDLPSYYSATCYFAAQWITEALEMVDGNIEDNEAFLAAVEDLEFDTPGGPMRLDEYGNPIQNVYIREVEEREDGRLWNVPIHTFEAVSQFWTYDPEEFLQQPVYSREFQGLD